MKKFLFALTCAFALIGPAQAHATEWIAAKVVKVEPERSRVVLDHERIGSLGMEAMTMPFKADKSARIERFKAGDKVRVHIQNVDGHLVVKRMKAAP